MPEVEGGDELVLLRQRRPLLAARALHPRLRQPRLLGHVWRRGLPVRRLLLALAATPHAAALSFTARFGGELGLTGGHLDALVPGVVVVLLLLGLHAQTALLGQSQHLFQTGDLFFFSQSRLRQPVDLLLLLHELIGPAPHLQQHPPVVLLQRPVLALQLPQPLRRRIRTALGPPRQCAGRLAAPEERFRVGACFGEEGAGGVVRLGGLAGQPLLRAGRQFRGFDGMASHLKEYYQLQYNNNTCY